MKIIFTRLFNIVSVCAFISASLVILSGIALSQEIDECLECHSDRELTQTDASGKVHSLYVDKKLYLESIHGRLHYTCVECHEQATLDHPAEGVPDAQCGPCHEEAQKKYTKSEHGKLVASADRRPPQCYDCHSMHYSFSSDDPRSNLNPGNIPQTCGQCHEDIVRGPGFIGSFIVARLKGHGKVNLGVDFRSDRCLNCHSEIFDHSTREKKKAVCTKCHEASKGSLNLGPIHQAEVFSNAPLRVAEKVFYGFGLGLVAFAFMSLASRKYSKPKAADEENKSH